MSEFGYAMMTVALALGLIVVLAFSIFLRLNKIKITKRSRHNRLGLFYLSIA